MKIIKLKNISNFIELKGRILFLLNDSNYVIINFLDLKINISQVYDFLKQNFLQKSNKNKKTFLFV